MPQPLEIDKFKGYAFDFDGTLADSLGAHEQARHDAFARMAELTGDSRFADTPAEIHGQAHHHGSHPQAIIGWILMETGVAKSVDDPVVTHTVNIKKSLYAQACKDGLPAIPGALDVLAHMHSHRPGTTGIVTTAHRDTEVVPFLKRYSLRGRLPDCRLVTHEDVGPDHLKPDPAAYVKILSKFWLNKNHNQGRLLAIEDSPNGILAAKKAGATALAVCTTHLADDFKHLEPDFVFESMEEVFESIKSRE